MCLVGCPILSLAPLRDPAVSVGLLHEPRCRNKDVDVFCHLKLRPLPPARQHARVRVVKMSSEMIRGDFGSDKHASKLRLVFSFDNIR